MIARVVLSVALVSAAGDTPLAEAAIGAGLTGALLMAAVARLRGRDEDRP